ncbi:MAG: hypothetical protein LBM25_04790 [Bacteroidales bacterium]|jgi:rod shape-determining protein MreD|nr:hypothetical protein [Bacteroidales bacterium]
MSRTILLTAFQFILIAIFQIFVLSNLNILSFCNPMIYVWFIILLPTSTPKWIVVLLSFIMGYTIDVFSGQSGINALSLTFIGVIRGGFISLFFADKDTQSNLRPSIKDMGFTNFLIFVSIIVVIHHTIYFMVEAFSFSEFFFILLRIVLSSIASIFLILFFDFLFFKTKR